MCLRPSQKALEKLHRPESCRSNRRTGSFTHLEYSDIPTNRPKTASQNNLTDMDFTTTRPKTASWKTKSNSDISKSDITMQTHGPLRRAISSTDVLRPRSSLRRERSNTHLINGFYHVGLKLRLRSQHLFLIPETNRRS